MNVDSIHGSTDGLPKEFDLYVKKSLFYIIQKVLSAYDRDIRRNYAISLDDIDDIPSPEEEMDAEKIHVRTEDSDFPFDDEMIAAAFEKLKDRYKRVLAYFYAMDMSCKDICELMELEEKSVKNYKSEALKNMGKRIREVDNNDKL